MGKTAEISISSMHLGQTLQYMYRQIHIVVKLQTFTINTGMIVDLSRLTPFPSNLEDRREKVGGHTLIICILPSRSCV